MRSQRLARHALTMAGLTLIALLALPATHASAAGGTPVRGAPVLTEQQLLNWFNSVSRPAYRASVPPEKLIGHYYEEGSREGVAADRAFVQAILETGWFSFNGSMVPPTANNFSGMGAYDSSGGEWVFRFPDARTGVRAQMHHLRIYADPGVNTTGSNLGSGSIARDVEDRYPARWRLVRNSTTSGQHNYWARAQVWEDFGGGMWATDVNYAQKVLGLYGDALAYNGYPRTAASQARWLQRDANAGGNHQSTAYLGSKVAGDRFLACDWNGDGRSTPGVFRDGRWTISNQRNGGGALATFSYGRHGDVPLCGDWNGNGRDGIGIVRDGRWHLRHTATGGTANLSFTFGRVSDGDIPLVGDWNGNGRDGIGIVRNGRWHLRQTASGGAGQIVFTYGRVTQGDIPLVGDWNGNGRDGIGIVRDGRWHQRQTASGGASQNTFTYGRVTQGDTPIVGDWNRNRVDTPAIIR